MDLDRNCKKIIFYFRNNMLQELIGYKYVLGHFVEHVFWQDSLTRLPRAELDSFFAHFDDNTFRNVF